MKKNNKRNSMIDWLCNDVVLCTCYLCYLVLCRCYVLFTGYTGYFLNFTHEEDYI